MKQTPKESPNNLSQVQTRKPNRMSGQLLSPSASPVRVSLGVYGWWEAGDE